MTDGTEEGEDGIGVSDIIGVIGGRDLTPVQDFIIGAINGILANPGGPCGSALTSAVRGAFGL